MRCGCKPWLQSSSMTEDDSICPGTCSMNNRCGLKLSNFTLVTPSISSKTSRIRSLLRADRPSWIYTTIAISSFALMLCTIIDQTYACRAPYCTDFWKRAQSGNRSAPGTDQTYDIPRLCIDLVYRDPHYTRILTDTSNGQSLI